MTVEQNIQTLRQLQGLKPTVTLNQPAGTGENIEQLKEKFIPESIEGLASDELLQRMPAALPACSDNSLHQNIAFVRQYTHGCSISCCSNVLSAGFLQDGHLSDHHFAGCKSRTQRIRLAKQTWQAMVQRVQMMLNVIACTLEGRPGFSVGDECYQPCNCSR